MVFKNNWEKTSNQLQLDNKTIKEMVKNAFNKIF